MQVHLPRTPQGLRNAAIQFDELNRRACKHEIHCEKCDSVSTILDSKHSYLRHELCDADMSCRDCGAALFFCLENMEYIPYSKSLVLPLDVQLQARLSGLYLQDIVDTSIFLDQHARRWPAGIHSGDTTDCESVREIFRRHPQDCRVDLSDPSHGKIYILYTVTSDSHDPFDTFQYSMWDQWLVVHNQPVQSRTWASRPFLLKATADGKKPTNLKSHLQFFAKWKHQFANNGIVLGPRRLFVTDSGGSRRLQQFDKISVKGFMISYGGDCVDLSAIMNIMNHANPNCRLTKYNISAVRMSSHQLAYSALHGLHGK